MRGNVVRLGDVPGDNEGQAVDVDELKRMLPELLALAERKADATDALAAGLDTAAYRCRVSKKAIRNLVKAMSKDKTRDMFAEAVELADLIEAVAPEVADDARYAA